MRNEQERLKVLQMLEDGKISSEDALKLLEALKPPFGHRFRQNFESEEFNDEWNEKLNRFSQSVDTFTRDFGDRFSDVAKDMEPKLRKAAKTVVEKTSMVVDDLSKALNESLKNLDEKTEEKSDASGFDTAETKADETDDKPKEN